MRQHHQQTGYLLFFVCLPHCFVFFLLFFFIFCMLGQQEPALLEHHDLLAWKHLQAVASRRTSRQRFFYCPHQLIFCFVFWTCTPAATQVDFCFCFPFPQVTQFLCCYCIFPQWPQVDCCFCFPFFFPFTQVDCFTWQTTPRPTIMSPGPPPVPFPFSISCMVKSKQDKFFHLLLFSSQLKHQPGQPPEMHLVRDFQRPVYLFLVFGICLAYTAHKD